MGALCPGQRLDDLAVEDRGLRPRHRRRISERRVTRNGESGKGGVAHTGKVDRGRQVLQISRPGINELPSQICETYFIDDARIEYVSIRSEKTLDADIGDVGARIRRGNPVRS